ncbi:MAG: hypothetical protein HYZ42_17005, partial [Bacteroidetes bacterium]|nr:hypothetical protein [Bacteroidota bacterium]
MKNLLILAICMLIVTGFSQTVTSSCNAPESIVKQFRKSADKLAVRRVEHISNTYKDSVTINKFISNQYLNALIAVYNATALAARDTIVALPIVLDNFYPYDVNSIYFGADSTKAWTKNLRNNILPCGNPAIDALLSRYYLKKTGYSHTFGTSLFHIISFRTDSNCYVNRLCDKFNALYAQGINAAAPNNEFQSDNFNITDSINSNYIELTYSLGWGGCMIPCMYRRYWTFRVYNDCSVGYIGSKGYNLPFNVFAGIQNNNKNTESLLIFPNPSDAFADIKIVSASV